jgi:hypothetical protein
LLDRDGTGCDAADASIDGFLPTHFPATRPRMDLTSFLRGAAHHIANPEAAIPGTTSHRTAGSPHEGSNPYT